MTLYDELQGVARDVLGEFKQGVVEYVEMTPGTGPVDNPGPATETVYLLAAAVKGVSFKYVQTGLANASNLQVNCAVLAGVEFKGTGFVRIDGVPHKITQVIAKPEAGMPVAYSLIVER